MKETYNPDITNVTESEDYRQRRAQERNEEVQNMTRWERVKHFFAGERQRLAWGVIILVTGFYLLITFLSFFFHAGQADQNRVTGYTMIENAKAPGEISNLGAAVGASASNFLIVDGVGLAALIVVVWCFTIGYRMANRNKRVHFFSYTMVSLFSILTFSMLLGALTYNWETTFFYPGGAFGHEANKWLIGLVGWPGMIGVNVILVMLWIMFTYKTLSRLFAQVKAIQLPKRKFNGDKDDDSDNGHADLSEFIGGRASGDNSGGDTADPRDAAVAAAAAVPEQGAPRRPQPRKPRNTAPAAPATPAKMAGIETARITNPHDPTGSYAHYRFPSLDLLQDAAMRTDRVDVEEQESNKQRITETLSNYGIKIKKIEVHVGPTVTLFEIIPEDGTRVSKIRGLEDDIALSLAALGIRIIAPMPGRGTIGIEVPNREPQIVPMRQVLASKAFQDSKAKLPICLGCTVSNEVFVADLTKMPHLLVAGATGKGKSVGLNAIITSLLYKKGPSELKFVLVDPKRVEFSVYADLDPYFFAKVPGEDRAIVTETARVVHTLNCLVQEMENRYRVLEDVKVRKVEDYNDKWRSELRELRDEHGEPRYQYMPYIVAIIDEFSDMIMTAGKEVETPIVRIAQKARAVGIHMIIATQRPSSTVITGLIKSNFPGRVAFAVSSMVDSRIIIDMSGAQRLIGRGDMLFMVDGEITRLQCPFVDTPDIVKIVEFIRNQEDNDRDVDHQEAFMLPEYVAGDEGGSGGEASTANLKERDPLFEEAVRWIVQSDTASTSSLQRRYEIGYNRAGRIMDQMEAAGIVGPSQGGKPRKVLVDPLQVEQILG
ncbi:MAG: DNA translocase FtsK 4TM domain-containing protein [Muribaculaceae bacterium]|nr:DNA translocase FtsK 4TM domain-containing protein [Muribaculaceae bacterium]